MSWRCQCLLWVLCFAVDLGGYYAGLRVVAVTSTPKTCGETCQVYLAGDHVVWFRSDDEWFVSSDRGSHWTKLVGLNESIREFQVCGTSSAIARTEEGAVRVTTDRGVTWHVVELPQRNGDLRFQGTFFCLGQPSGPGMWISMAAQARQQEPAPSYAIRSVSGSGYVVDRPVVFFSTDLGKNWRGKPLPENRSYALKAIRFWNRANGMAVGDSGVYYTRDGGKEWTLSRVPASDDDPWQDFRYVGLALGDATAGLIGVDGGKFLRSTNMGADWHSVGMLALSPSESPLVMLSDKWVLGITVGETLHVSSDGGSNWRRFGFRDKARMIAATNKTACVLSGSQLTWIAFE